MTRENGTRESYSPPEPVRTTQAVFLERQSYRRRRLLDLARLLPLLGALLLLIPLLWPDPATDAEHAMPMSGAISYIFAVWACLIIGAVLFGVGARHWGGDDRQSDRGRE